MGTHTIIQGDCLKRIKEIEDNSIPLTISSPPYFCAKDYHDDKDNIGRMTNYQKYLNIIKELLKEIYRILTPGGHICWNTSPILFDGKRIGIPFDTHRMFEELGFEFLEDVVWHKGMGSAKLRCGGFYQNKGRPTTWHANICTEYIFIYKKPGERRVGKFNPINSYYSTGVPKDLSSNVWFFNPETQKHYHDAPFPRELPKRLILLYSYLGDTVLDVFAGSFTVSKVARDLGRNSIGIELSEEYIKKAKEDMGFYQRSLFGDAEYIEK